MAAQVQGADSRLVSLCTQLNTRYQTAKTSLRVSTFSSQLYFKIEQIVMQILCYILIINLQDLIHKLQDNVHEHEAYNENFSECAEWVNTLARRLQVCADMAGDKHDVEDRLAKLQVLQQLNTKHLYNCLLYQNNITFSSNTSLIIIYQIYK